MLNRYKYNNWDEPYPQNIIEYLMTPCPFGLRLLNLLVQKVLRINAEVPFMVHFTSTVSKTVILGKGVAKSIANSGNCYIQGINRVEIGDETLIAPGVKIISANHLKTDIKKHDKSSGPVKIGKNCWIGCNSIILPGISIGDNVIIAAGAVVTKSFGSNIVLAGNPASIIKENQL